MKKLPALVALATLGAFSAGAHAQDTFVGLTWGETSNNMERSSALKANLGNPRFDDVIENSGTWGLRAGQQTDANRFYATCENPCAGASRWTPSIPARASAWPWSRTYRTATAASSAWGNRIWAARCSALG